MVRKRRKGKKILKIVLALVLVLAVAGYFLIYRPRQEAQFSMDTTVNTVTVSTQTITSTLSASGTIAAKDSYTITSMVDGEVISADFEEGDTVEKDQVLYQIESSTQNTRVENATNDLSRAEKNYDTAVRNYNEAAADLSGNTYKSTQAGYVRNIQIQEGNPLSNGSIIADLYSDQVMEAYIPFLSGEAEQIPVGSTATLYISTTLEAIEGTVVSVASLEESNSGGQLTKKVLVRVNNPGGLTTSMSATAEINGFMSTGDGAFSPTKNSSLQVSGLGGSLTITEVLIHEGDYINVGTAIASLDAGDVSDILENLSNSIDSASSSVENAQSSLQSSQETLDNYTIKAPIAGTVVTKNVKAGDKIQNGNNTTSLAVIYDLSSVSFDMNIDELDISNVSIGQKVTVTADAFEDQTFEGEVTKKSMEGTTSNGVTYYPVTVTITDFGSLMPGMNVDGVITLSEAVDVVSVPTDALQRGNLVYVQGTAPEDSEQSGYPAVPEGFYAVEVTTGLADTNYVEITSGNLNAGDTIYIAQSSVPTSFDDMMMGGDDFGGGMGGDMGGGPGGGPGGGGGGPQF